MKQPNYESILKSKIDHYGDVEAARAFAAAEYAEGRVNFALSVEPKPVLLIRGDLSIEQVNQLIRDLATSLPRWHVLLNTDGRLESLTIQTAHAGVGLTDDEEYRLQLIVGKHGKYKPL